LSPHSETKYVQVYSAKGETEAQIIKALLESNDIPSFFNYEAAYSASVRVVDAVARVKVMVLPEDAAAALEMIDNADKPDAEK
jgi:hypothetical protein